MVSGWIAGLRAAAIVLSIAGCVPYAPYAGGYGPAPYDGLPGGGYYGVEQEPGVGYYAQPRPYGGYDTGRFDEDYARPRGDRGNLYRQQQSYNQALLAQQRQQSQAVQQQQQYNNAVVAQQNAYNQALLAQQRAAQGR